jgi:uncharacterized Zn-finger protein
MSQNPLIFSTSLGNISSVTTSTLIQPQNLQCKICLKIFSTNGNLKNHITTIHQNLRPFKCTFPNCNKSYSNKSRLLVHERTHTGQRPFICHICNKTFNEKGNLKTHICFHSNNRPFICDMCGKSYKTNGHLKDHYEIHHLNVKKFICDICGTRFGRSSTLKAHLRTHTGERNYSCPIEGCVKTFAEKGNMMIHYIRHLKRMNKTNKKNENRRCCNIFETLNCRDNNVVRNNDLGFSEYCVVQGEQSNKIKNVEVIIVNNNEIEDKRELIQIEGMK